MASNIPVIVQGNSFSLAIPLQIYYINGDQMDLQDYTPDPTDDVTVQLKGSRRNYTYTPTIDGNVANIDLSGNELADNYGVVVSVVKANGQRLRSFRTDQFFIVESSDDLTMDDIIQGLEENVIYLNSQAFVAGEDGRGIESIVKTSTAGLVDTYTITYSDDTTTTFQVTNGANGQAGAQGVGITSIEKTGTSGLVDTYTITLSNGQTSTFEVTNGQDGHDLGLAVIVDDLTTGGHEDALSAEMGKVLYNGTRQNYIKGYFINAAGAVDVSSVWNLTDYIPCVQGNSIVWTPGGTAAICALVFYDSEKVQLSAYKATAARRTITAPANAAFLRASFQDNYGGEYNRVPVTVAGEPYARQEWMQGNKDIANTHIPQKVNENLFGYLYDNFGYEVVPTDAMAFANMTMGSTGHAAEPSSSRVIAEFPVKYGYGVIVKPLAGYRVDLRFYTYEEVGISQANTSTFIFEWGVTTGNIMIPVPHNAHMCVVWVARASGNATFLVDDAKSAFSVAMVKIPDQKRFIRSINHKGYNLTHPENTLPAFRESRRQGFHYVETDLRTTSDGVIVLLHDESINATARNADGSEISGTININSITYEQALEYDFGIRRGQQFAGTKIPTLAQFLALCKNLSLHPYLELKSVSAAAVVQAVSDAGMRGNVTYLGNTTYLESVKNLDPNARLAILGGASIEVCSSLKSATNEVFVDVESRVDISAYKNAGIAVEKYTIDDIGALFAVDSYVSGITSNRWAYDKLMYIKGLTE